MLKGRNKRYFQQQRPIRHKEEVAENNDAKIDQDVPGFPHGHAAENIIHPKNKTDEQTAAVVVTDGEKINYTNVLEEGSSDASANAFEATEKVQE